MAVTISRKAVKERGSYIEVDLSASGDIVQVDLTAVRGQMVDWYTDPVSWYRSADVEVSFSNGPLSDLAISGTGVGVSGGSWLDHENADKRNDVERSSLNALRFRATAANQKVVVWTGVDLRDGAARAVTLN